MSKYLAALPDQEVFYQTLLLTSVTESLGNIMPWDKNNIYQCWSNFAVSVWLMACHATMLSHFT